MGPILILVLLALISAGETFALHIPWIVAVAFFIAWAVGLVFGRARRSVWQQMGPAPGAGLRIERRDRVCRISQPSMRRVR